MMLQNYLKIDKKAIQYHKMFWKCFKCLFLKSKLNCERGPSCKSNQSMWPLPWKRLPISALESINKSPIFNTWTTDVFRHTLGLMYKARCWIVSANSKEHFYFRGLFDLIFDYKLITNICGVNLICKWVLLVFLESGNFALHLCLSLL